MELLQGLQIHIANDHDFELGVQIESGLLMGTTSYRNLALRFMESSMAILDLLSPSSADTRHFSALAFFFSERVLWFSD
jgi:hypothetical protein